MYDVIIIGAGVSGSAIARELSRYQLKLCVLEREGRCMLRYIQGKQRHVHAGFDAEPGTLMAKLNVRGNKMMESLSHDLDFPFIRNGSLVVCHTADDISRLEELKARGEKNGVKDLRLLNRNELKQMETNISDDAAAALYAPSGGIVCPFGLNIALAENAAANGAEFRFHTEVTDIRKSGDCWILSTKRSGEYRTKIVVNAAGVYADRFHNMVSSRKIHITPRKGEYCLLDRTCGNHVTHYRVRPSRKIRQRGACHAYRSREPADRSHRQRHH